LGFFTGEPRSATVYALRDTDVVRFSRDGFNALQSKLPQTTFQFTKQVITGLHRAVLAKASRTSLYVALVPLNVDVPLADFASRLAEVVSQYSRCVHLSSASVDEMFHRKRISQTPSGHLNEIRLVTWLDEQEKACPVVAIYEADSSPSNPLHGERHRRL
jgi:CRP-like cAMP-binding protein